MPQLAVFPKAYLDQLCIDGSMSIYEWIDLASTLDVDGLEFYSGILELQNPNNWPAIHSYLRGKNLPMPMLCCSPDFTHPDPQFRQQQIDIEKGWIEMTAALGGRYCRVLSGQRRPEVSRAEGIRYAAECINACIPYAAERGVTLILENHYKDGFWVYPEFAQMIDVFCDLVAAIDSPHFGVNFDPSNTLIAGEDPLEMLDRVKHRTVTMHASDRYLSEGTFEDLRREENSVGYAQRLRHGEIGKGMNDYDAIFRVLRDEGFDGWISIEDGVDGFDQLKGSVAFVRRKIKEYWGEPSPLNDDFTLTTAKG